MTAQQTFTQESSHMRATAYGLLARFLAPPNEDTHAWMLFEFMKAWKDMCPELGLEHQVIPFLNQLEEKLTVRLPESLPAEYAILFEPHSSMSAPPYELEYAKESPQEGLNMNYEMADISGFYKAFGLKLSSRNPERCDHLATELEFLQFLCLKESYALEKKDETLRDRVRDGRQKFLMDHVLRWTGKFEKRLEEIYPEGIYYPVAKIIAAFSLHDRGVLSG